MALVTSNYEFLFVDVGKNGHASDEGSLKNTAFHKRLSAKTLYLPTQEATKQDKNFVFVAAEAFALHKNLMKPFPLKALTKEQCSFNYRLARARRMVKNTFGNLSNRFWIFHTAINL